MDASGELTAPAAAIVPRERRRFIAFHKRDRNFFLVFLAVCWLGVLMGFHPAVTRRFAGHADYPAPLILQIHAFAFSAWLLLLTTQVALIRARRPALHMKLGLVGGGAGPDDGAQRILLGNVQPALLLRTSAQQPGLLHPADLLRAGVHIACGRRAPRKNPSSHKRLILLATTIIVEAAYSRWWGHSLEQAFGDGLGGMLINTYAGTNLILLGALGYDLWTRGRLHMVYEIVVPLILVGEIATTLIYHSPRWLPIARVIIGR